MIYINKSAEYGAIGAEVSPQWYTARNPSAVVTETRVGLVIGGTIVAVPQETQAGTDTDPVPEG